MHRQGVTDRVDGCPICKGSVTFPRRKRRINVRDGVWFELCDLCYEGISAFVQKKAKKTPGKKPQHPATRRRRKP